MSVCISHAILELLPHLNVKMRRRNRGNITRDQHEVPAGQDTTNLQDGKTSRWADMPHMHLPSQRIPTINRKAALNTPLTL